MIFENFGLPDDEHIMTIDGDGFPFVGIAIGKPIPDDFLGKNDEIMRSHCDFSSFLHHAMEHSRSAIDKGLHAMITEILDNIFVLWFEMVSAFHQLAIG